MNSELLNYTTIGIFYFVLCLFIYDDRLEGWIFILFFVTNFLAGYKLILDIYKDNPMVDFSRIDNFLVDFMLSSFTLFGVSILLIVLILLYFAPTKHVKSVSMDYIILMGMLWVVLMLVNTFFSGDKPKLPYAPVYGLGIVMILVSNLLMILGFREISLESLSGSLPLSKTNRKRMNLYKTLMIMCIFLIGFSFYLFIVTQSPLATPEMFLMFIFILYVMCFIMIYFGYKILNLSKDKMITDNGKNIKSE